MHFNTSFPITILLTLKKKIFVCNENGWLNILTTVHNKRQPYNSLFQYFMPQYLYWASALPPPPLSKNRVYQEVLFHLFIRKLSYIMWILLCINVYTIMYRCEYYHVYVYTIMYRCEYYLGSTRYVYYISKIK